jgi:uncharacterized membrane protein
MSPDDDLRMEVAELSARVAALETALRLRAGGSTEQRPSKPSSQESIKPSLTLENRIGAQVLNRLGILAVLIGVAWFLKLAFDRNWIGPPIRVAVGLVSAAGLMAWSEVYFRRRGFFAFSYSIKALATSIAYLSLWAASSVFHLAPAWVVFCAMTAVTVVNAVLARRQDSEVLALYALAGGLATPGLLDIGHSNEVFLFFYLALLNLGSLVLLALHPWKRMAWAALLGTGFYSLAMTFGEDNPAHWPVTAFFLAVYFACFTAASWLLSRVAGPSALNAFFPVAFPSAGAAVTWLALMVLFGARVLQGGRPWATVGLAAGCLLMAMVRPKPEVLARTNLGLGIIFITVAIPLEFHGPTATLCWLGEALILVALARYSSQSIFHLFATGVLTLAAWSLVWDWILGTPYPLAVVRNSHFATSLSAAAVFAMVAMLSRGKGSFAGWRYLAGFATVAFSLTILIAVSLEIRHYWFCGAGFFADFCYGYGQLEGRTIAAGWSYSAWWMLYGAALMAAGFLRRSAFVRWQALVVLAFSIAKVFLNGVSQQNQGYRVLSFLALGVLLLAISFAYQKDWLRLRG